MTCLKTEFAFVCAALSMTTAVLAQSSRPGWGSTPYSNSPGSGVTFRVWAPNATSVYVPGQFNSWTTSATPLGKELSNSVWTGVWSADVPGASNVAGPLQLILSYTDPVPANAVERFYGIKLAP